MSLNWEEHYSTEVSSIDRQHQKLFQYINKLESCIKNNVFEGTEVDNILDFLGTYTKVHFDHEEFCMNDLKCPVSGKNKKAHDSFITFFMNFQSNYNSSDELEKKKSEIISLHKMAEDWLINHICRIDIHIKSCKKK